MRLNAFERKALIIIAITGIFSKTVMAQTQLVSNTIARNNAIATPESVKTAPLNTNILPLFGGTPRSKQQKAEDEAFLKSCDKIFPNRHEGSSFFAERGWEYLAEGELDTAVHRFNLCYMLEPENVEAYWGLGVICYHRGQQQEAVTLMNRGLKIAPENAGLMVDIATLYIQQYEQTQAVEPLGLAQQLLGKSLGIDSTNANTYMKLAITHYYQEDFDKAWENLHKCRDIDFKAVDLTLLTQLMVKKPDPKGLFK